MECSSRAVCKGLCNRHYQAMLKYGDPLKRVRPLPGPGICTADGCTAATRSIGALHCESHYQRLRRRGTTERYQPPAIIEHTGGYLLEHAPGNTVPSARRRSRVYQHRKVFHDAHGDGPFQCHVCDGPVTWAEMHVDHLDDDPQNNALDNLAPACPTCNTWRGKHKMVATQRANGVQLTAFGQTHCKAEWSRIVGLPLTTLSRRLKEGWPAEKALCTPSGPTGRKTTAKAATPLSAHAGQSWAGR